MKGIKIEGLIRKMIDFNIYDCIVVRKSGRKGFEKMPVNFLNIPQF